MKLKQMAQMKWGEARPEGEGAAGVVEGAAIEAGQSLLCADNDNTK